MLARLTALDPRWKERALRQAGAVRRLAKEMPPSDSLWLDRLHAAGELTDYQAAALSAGRDAELRVGPYLIAETLGPRTRLAFGPAGASVLVACGECSEALSQVCRTAVSHPAVQAPEEVIASDAGCWVRSLHVGGPTLAERLAARGRMEGEEAWRLARRLAVGLASAEAAGLIHGEIHAANVRLPPAGAVLVNCGVAPLLPPRSGDTGRGGWVEPPSGPPTFGTDADLAAFGALLWGALAGRPPFLFAPRRFGTVDARELPLGPIGDLAPDTPEPLANLVDALNGHRPERRPASFAEVAAALRPAKKPISPLRTAGWAVACGAVLAGFVGAAAGPAEQGETAASAPKRPAATESPVVIEEVLEQPAPAVRRVAVP
ncbi:MAG: hypothetical protein AAF907_00400 [Planctomycetota bacterium]